jgi:hypothetical protein
VIEAADLVGGIPIHQSQPLHHSGGLALNIDLVVLKYQIVISFGGVIHSGKVDFIAH